MQPIAAVLCLRHDNGFKDTVQRIHDGAIGDIVALQANDLRGPIWRRERTPEMSEMTWQMRNWYYYTWLSGDFIVEQHCHNMDKAAWVFKGDMPTSCTGVGGRQVRTDPKYGNIYDQCRSCSLVCCRTGSAAFSVLRLPAE